MKTRSRSILIILFILLPILVVNIACGLSSLTSATETPTPTETPLPTSTNTPEPTATYTATPNLRATQAAEREQAIRDLLVQLDLPADTGSLAWYQTIPEDISLEGPSGYFQTFAEDVVASDFVLYSRMTWNTNSWPFCGIWFRSDTRWAKGDQYALWFLRFSGLPAFEIEYYHDGYFTSNVTEKVRFSSFLDLDDGATNEFILAAIGNEFKVFINGNFEGRYYDWSSKLSDGRFAFIGYQDSGETTCSFDNTWVWTYK